MRIRSGKIPSKLLRIICSLSLLFGLPVVGMGSDKPNSQTVELRGFAFAISNTSGKADNLIMVGQNSACRVDTRSGKILWSAQNLESIDSAPLIVGNVVLYSGGGGNFTLYALNAQNGRLLWRRDHNSTVLATDGVSAFVNEVPGEGVLALSPRSGKKLWHFEHIGPRSVNQIVYYQGKLFTNEDVLDASNGKRIQRLPELLALAAASGKVFSLTQEHAVEALDAASGRKLWTVPAPPDMNPIVIQAQGDYVAAVFYQEYPFSAHRGVLRAYSTSDGRQLWEVTLNTKHELLPDPIGMDDKYVYVSEPMDAGTGATVKALDLSSGREVWSYDESKETDGPPVPLEDAVFITSDYRKLLVLDKNTGKPLRKISCPGQ